MNLNFVISFSLITFLPFQFVGGDDFASWEANMNKYVDTVSADFSAYVNVLEDEMSRISMGAGGKGGDKGNEDPNKKPPANEDPNKKPPEGNADPNKPAQDPNKPPENAPPYDPTKKDWSQVGIPVSFLSDDGSIMEVVNDPSGMYEGMDGAIAHIPL